MFAVAVVTVCWSYENPNKLSKGPGGWLNTFRLLL